MIRHIITADAIVIPTESGIIQYSKDDGLYAEVLNICNQKESTINDIKNLEFNLNYENDDISISYNNETEKSEIFYNGKYYEIPNDFLKTILSLNKSNCGFKSRFVVNFLIKLINNPFFKFEELYDKLIKEGFIFLSNGDIIIQKDYEQETEGYYYNKERNFASKDAIKTTLVILDPSTINSDLSFMDYLVLDHIFFSDKILNNSWIRNEKLFLKTFSFIVKQKELNIEEFKAAILAAFSNYKISASDISAGMKYYKDDRIKFFYHLVRLLKTGKELLEDEGDVLF